VIRRLVAQHVFLQNLVEAELACYLGSVELGFLEYVKTAIRAASLLSTNYTITKVMTYLITIKRIG
jgi:hypothetical protein